MANNSVRLSSRLFGTAGALVFAKLFFPKSDQLDTMEAEGVRRPAVS